MTSTSPSSAPPGERPVRLSPAYTEAWELFVDWCTTTGHTLLPAGSSTVLAFLHDCPAAPATQAVRVRAITTAHTRTGHLTPHRTPEILDVLRGRPRRPDPRIPLPPGHVDQLLADLPIHGWTAGWFGRRDRALLVLADTHLTYRAIADLTVGDIYLAPAGATIYSGKEAVELPTGADSTRCRPCALALWIDVLQLAATSATVRVARFVHPRRPLDRRRAAPVLSARRSYRGHPAAALGEQPLGPARPATDRAHPPHPVPPYPQRRAP